MPLLRRYSLTAALLLSLPALAHAGTYVWKITDPDPAKSTQSPTYSGGTHQLTLSNGTSLTEPYYLLGNAPIVYGNGNEKGNYGDCSGMITTTYTWHADPGLTDATDPPPVSVIVSETCYVNVQGASATTAPVAGICDTGLGVSAALVQLHMPNGQLYVNTACTFTRYKVATGGKTVTLTCSPRAQCLVPYASTYVRYTPAISPVFVYPGGTMIDPADKARKALTGQQITGTLSSLPFTPAAGSTYSWSASAAPVPPATATTGGDIFKTYDPFLSSNQLVLLSSTDLTGASFSFYDKSKETITLTCNANLVTPSGTTLAVTAKSVPIAVLKPTVTKWVINPAQDNTGYFLHLTPHTYGYLTIWQPVTIAVPLPFSGGLGGFAQLVTPNRSSARNPIAGKPTTYYLQVPYTKSDGSQGWKLPTQGRDGQFPYVGTTGITWDVSADGTSGDEPAQSYLPADIDQGGIDWYTGTTHDFFTSWLIYKPTAANSVWVPLQKIDWSTNITVNRAPQGNWVASVNGPVTMPTQGSDASDYPQWTVINDFSKMQIRPVQP